MVRVTMDLAKIIVGVGSGLSVGMASAHGLTPVHHLDEVAMPAMTIIAGIALVKSLSKMTQLVKVRLTHAPTT